MQNMTQRDALITENYILADKKLIFRKDIFSSEHEEKKFL